ncbi:dynamin family protein [Nonomuraea sp. CA-141351]|uniref:dynamin family protein n=1 Tax=Nonomuraea sp. CA-141351 TaxID=3239996 RepID=UPI003D8FF83B
MSDDDLAGVRDDDGFDAFGTKGARKPNSGATADDQSAPEEPPAPEDAGASEEAAAATEEAGAAQDTAPSQELTTSEGPETSASASEEQPSSEQPPASAEAAEPTAVEPDQATHAESTAAAGPDASGEPAAVAGPDASDESPAASGESSAAGSVASGESAAADPDVSGEPVDTVDQPTPEPAGAADDAVSEEPAADVAEAASAGPADPVDAADSERPSLFVKPAILGGPGARKASPAAPPAVQDEPGARDEVADPGAEQQGAEESSSGEQPQATAADDEQPRDADATDEQPQPEQPQSEQAQGDPPPGAEAQGERQPGNGDASVEDESKGGPPRAEELPAEAAEALMAALDTLRQTVADLRFGLDLPGVEEAKQTQADLLAQLEDYVLPRVRTSAAPALIVIAGSTGAGKSTLVNTLAEKNISRTGVRRPTTGVPVLVCHPDDREWFAEGELLGGLERIDKPSPEAGMRSVVVVATEKLPQGVALLDTPDIDSVVEEHHEIAHRMLDAADLWIFVTTAARYADAPAWSLLKLAKERGARLAIVLSRVQPRAAEVVLKHFVRMLTEYGLGEIDRFVISESKVTDGRLPDSEVTELRLWLAELSVDEERRAQAVRETLNGVLNSFRTRVPALARHLEGQVAFRAELRSDVEAAFLGALSEIDKASKNGSLLHGEVLARWQDFAGSGDLMRSLQLRKRGRSAKHAPERVLAFKAAIRAGLESVIVAAANRATEEVVARWRHRSELGAKLGEGLDRPSDNLVRHTGRAIASWQEHLSELVRTDGVAKRSVSKLVSFDPDSLALIFTVAMFSGSNGEGVPHRLVNALLGAESLRGIGAKALSDLRARIGMLFDEESMRYVQALDSAGIPDESVATRLYQATYNLEVVR